METIQKNIMLESSKSRLPGLIPSIEMGYYKYDDILGKWNKIASGVTSDFIFSNDDLPKTNDGKIYYSYGLNGKNGCNGNWNKFPCDININNIKDYNFIGFINDNKIELPLVKDEKGNFILRYRTMMTLYYWLMKFYKELTFYKVCKRKNNKAWIITSEIDYSNLQIKGFFTSLPDAANYEINDIIGISSNSDVFHSFFNKDFFKERIDLIFYEFVNKSIGKLEIPLNIDGRLVPDFLYYSEINEWYDWLNSNKDTTDCCIKEKYKEMGGDTMLSFLNDKLALFKDTVQYLSKIVSSPYMNVSLLIPVEYDDMGEFSLYSQQWIGGNKYYVGDVVIYVSEDDRNGSSYVLTRGDNYELIEMNDLFYNSIIRSATYTIRKMANYSAIIAECETELSDSGNGNFIDSTNYNKVVYYDEEKGKCYLPLAYFCGYFNEKYNEIYFDETSNGRLLHWEKNGDSDSIKELNIDGYNNNWTLKNANIEFKTESKLLSLRKYKKSYDDNGNELPGILNYDVNDGVKELKPELGFIFEAGQAYNLNKIVDDITGKELYYGDVIESITYGESKDGPFGERSFNSHFIKFEYYIGSRLYEKYYEGNKYWSAFETSEKSTFTGVKYVEVYNVKIDKELTGVTVDGKTKNFKYDEVDFDSKYTTIYNEDIDFAPKKCIISSATTVSDQLFDKNEINDTYNIINSLLYKEEYKMGIATPVKTDVNVYIDRGINAAFERHLILGEVNTYQDMENYRNNYFNFK